MYEEPLDDKVVAGSIKAISECDTLIIAGTSLVVYPAAGLIRYYRGHKLILINLSQVPNEDDIDYVYHGKAGEVFSHLM